MRAALFLIGALFLFPCEGFAAPGEAGVSAEDSTTTARKRRKRRKRRRKKKKRAAKPKKVEAPPVEEAAPAAEATSAAEAAPASKAPAEGGSLRRSNSMEFDARLVRGERAAGAVYLFQRVPRPLPGFVELKRRYADHITQPLLHREAGEPAVGKAKADKKAARGSR